MTPTEILEERTALESDAVPADVATLGELLHLRARRRGEAVALTFLDDGETVGAQWSYAELDARARAIAAELGRHAEAGERALLVYPPGLDFAAAFLGCLYAGVVAVPIYPPRRRGPAERLASLVTDCSPALCLVPEVFAPRTEALKTAVPALAEVRWITTDRIAPAETGSWSVPTGLGRDSLAFLQYTSGSTADPKGVMVTHGNLLHNEAMITRAFEQDEDSVVVSWLPLYHDMGLIGSLLQPLVCGARCVLMAPAAFLQKPMRWLRAISDHRATTSGGPDFAYALCRRKIDPTQCEGLDLSSWRVAFNGAEPVRSSTLDAFAETFAPHGFDRRAFYPCYGLAEGTLLASGGTVGAGAESLALDASRLDEHRIVPAKEAEGRRLVASGHTWAGQEVVIVDPESCLLCAEDRVGEIWLRGGSVAAGYWNRPELSQKTFGARLADGSDGTYLRTGDLGFLHRGDVFVTGRSKDLIILRGRNLYPQDLEATAEAAHPALRPGCGAAFSVETDGEERLVLVQEVSRHAKGDVEALVAAVRQAIAETHEAALHDLLLIREGTLPKTSSGKVRRHATRAAYLDGELIPAHKAAQPTDRTLSTAPPSTSSGTAATLAERVAREAGALLDGVAIDPARSLGAQGLDSLRAVELAHVLDRELGLAVELDDLLAAVPLAELAEEWEARQPAVRSDGDEPTPLPASFELSRGQRALVFLERLAPEGGAYNIAAAARIHGRLDTAAFGRAARRLAERHPMLRAVVEGDGGTLNQRITDVAPAVSIQDSEGQDEAEVLDTLSRRAFTPFDLAAGPLLRFDLRRRGDEEHLLALSIHHAISDFWSLALMLDELGELYRREAGEAVEPAPAPRHHYADFVADQQRWLAGEDGARARAFWEKELGGPAPVLELPTDRPRPAVMGHRGDSRPLVIPAATAEALGELARRQGATLFMVLQAAWGALLHRIAQQDEIWIGSPTAGRHDARLSGVVGYFVNPVVLRQRFAPGLGFGEHVDALRSSSLAAFAHQRYPFALLAEALQGERDASRSPLFQTMLILQRSPGGTGLDTFALGEEDALAADAPLPWAGLGLRSLALPRRPVQFDLTLQMAEHPSGGLVGSLQFATDLFDGTTAERLVESLGVLLAGAVGNPRRRIDGLPLLSAAQRVQVMGESTAVEVGGDPFLPTALAAQAEASPERMALVLGDEALGYGELLLRVRRLAHHLAALGAGPETVVGVALERSLDLVVTLWAVLETGAAYLPLDPGYPAERLRHVVADAGASLLVTRRGLAGLFGDDDGCRLLALEEEAETLAGQPSEPLPRRFEGSLPAYVIYTSGSTGKPKGVVVPHATVSNFFVGMDARILPGRKPSPGDPSPGDWMAVTSISFDISVLELLYTLTRGFTVVLRPSLAEATAPPLVSRHPEQAIGFSLMYFSSDVDLPPAERYRLLLEGVRVADKAGFEAVWTPERHFHAFGGLFPNPSVTSAALATITENLSIRAGSVVLPLHDPIRVAEEWSVVDNLSGGRVGMAAASGWQPNDFVLAPENYHERKEIFARHLETLRRLWRGETIERPNGVGESTEVSILPRPIQPELPIWVTAAGAPQTFEQAGQLGASLLTHLLGQSLDEVREKIALYRRAYRESGAPGEGHVTLMLHTFVGPDPEQVKETVREPFTRYLSTSFGLMKNLAPGQDLDSMNEDDLALLLRRAFDRYFDTSGLFGTPEQALAQVDELKEIGVDEVACLVDFGVETDTVLASLDDLVTVRRAANPDSATRAALSAARTVAEESIPVEIVRRGIRFLQCTPSLARALLADPRADEALATLETMMVGGEALPPDLARALTEKLAAGERPGRLLNMYGPTETTIWSSVAEIGVETPITLGRPIVNTELRVVDRGLEPLPIGVPGELLIGGDGVVRGYHGRPALTAERFVPDPFASAEEEGGRRLYRTGDLVKLGADGRPIFLGRIDHQIKLRGHRIELGEIESALHRQEGVREAVVLARQDDPAADPRLVAWVVPAARRIGHLEEPSSAERQKVFDGIEGTAPQTYRLPNGLEVAQLSSPQTNAIYREIWEDDVYRRHGVDLDGLDEGAVIFDVGANIGLFSLFAHQQVRDPRIYAFEPIPTTFEVLRTNMALYGPGARIHNLGLSGETGQASFTFYPQMAGLSGQFAEGDTQATRSIIREWVERQATARDDVARPSDEELDALVADYLVSETHECQLEPLSAVLRREGIERIDYLKIDVEGAEIQVLQGIDDEDWPKIRQIALEIHSVPLLEESTAILEARGFELEADEFLAADDQIDTVYMLYAVRPGEAAEPAERRTGGDAEPIATPTPEALLTALAKELPDAMVPSDVVILDRLPLLPNGKIDRKALPVPGGAAEARTLRPVVAPADELEAKIATVWGELLGGAEVSVEDNFFESGGNSLLLMQAHGRLREALDREISLVDLMRYPTVRALARHLGGATRAKAVEEKKKLDDRVARQRRAFGRKKKRPPTKRGR